jgi:hypothetical protein
VDILYYWNLDSVSLLRGNFNVLVFSMLMGEPSKDEVSRVVSPNGKVDAVMCETNGGATTSFGYDIYVVEHGKQPFGTAAISLYGAVRSKSAYGANLEWISPDSVAVEYLASKSLNIKKPTQIVGNQTIHFVIQKGIIDNNAPLGGMVYNLRGRQ